MCLETHFPMFIIHASSHFVKYVPEYYNVGHANLGIFSIKRDPVSFNPHHKVMYQTIHQYHAMKRVSSVKRFNASPAQSCHLNLRQTHQFVKFLKMTFK